MITIIDYGVGNLGSIAKMLDYLGIKVNITSSISEISSAEKIILPGVGSFDYAINEIKHRGLKKVLNKKALIDKIPFLGICLGMQLLTNSSEEGSLPGLGFINAETKKFHFTHKSLKIPHMGWNTINLNRESNLTNEMYNIENRFYFVHSYYVKCLDSKNSISTTNYGIDFDSIIQNKNIYGAQFHPEKSHKFGMKLFENFSKL